MSAPAHTFAAQPPQYFPSVSFFQHAAHVENFVLADDLRFVTSRALNRMRIKTNTGATWLTIPVLTKGKAQQLIKDVRIVNEMNWRQKHWKALHCHYARAPYFEKYAEAVASILQREWKFLVDLNLATIALLQRKLHLHCHWHRSSEWGIQAEGTGRILAMARHLESGLYLAEDAHKNYLMEQDFVAANVQLRYANFMTRSYHQQYDGFLPQLSALDLLFNEGEEAPKLLAQP